MSCDPGRIEKAKELAALHGGAIIADGETRAFQVGKRDGWWKYGRGAHNGDCVWQYAQLHWREFLPDGNLAEINKNR